MVEMSCVQGFRLRLADRNETATHRSARTISVSSANQFLSFPHRDNSYHITSHLLAIAEQHYYRRPAIWGLVGGQVSGY